MKNEKIKKIVREVYAEVAKKETSCCTGTQAPCSRSTPTIEEISKRIGYNEEDMNSVPEDANLGLGCGNPVALASLKEGETVLDLGSGAGFDCFLAANRVGKNGRVIGVDMTPKMIDKARKNARKGKCQNVEFRLGEIENLPVADGTIDIVISNCVINLSPDKKRVFKEAFRALKPGGRLMISDIVLLRKLSEDVRNSVKAYVGCLSGAKMKNKYLKLIKEAGFRKIKVAEENRFPSENMTNDPIAQAIMKSSEMTAEKTKKVLNSLASVRVSCLKSRES